MKNLVSMILLIIVFSSINLFASSNEREKIFLSESSCYRQVAFHEQMMALQKSQRLIEIKKMNSSNVISILSQGIIKDFLFDDNKFFVLTTTSIEEWSLASGELTKSISFPIPSDALGFAVNQDKIFVAQDRDGVTILKKNSGEYIESIPVPGRVTDLTLSDESVFAFSDGAEVMGSVILNGIFGFDINSHQLIKKTLLNGSPMDAIDLKGDYFYVGSSFYWKLDKKKVMSKKILNSYSRVYLPKDEFASGKPFIDESNIYFCTQGNRPKVFSL